MLFKLLIMLFNFSKSLISHKIFKRDCSSKKGIFASKVTEIKPRTNQQKKYDDFLKNQSIKLVIGNGPAGTGKTLLACKNAINQFNSNQIKKIVITRPVISVEEDIGFLPGNINQKMNPWTIPMFDVFKEQYSSNELKYLLSENKIEIAPLGLMRGRTFKDSFVIADEMQNSTPAQMLMLLTRIGENSKLVITGDLNQSDLKSVNGFQDLIQKLLSKYDNNYHQMMKDEMSLVNFKEKDILRSQLVSTILELYNN